MGIDLKRLQVCQYMYMVDSIIIIIIIIINFSTKALLIEQNHLTYSSQ